VIFLQSGSANKQRLLCLPKEGRRRKHYSALVSAHQTTNSSLLIRPYPAFLFIFTAISHFPPSHSIWLRNEPSLCECRSPYCAHCSSASILRPTHYLTCTPLPHINACVHHRLAPPQRVRVLPYRTCTYHFAALLRCHTLPVASQLDRWSNLPALLL